MRQRPGRRQQSSAVLRRKVSRKQAHDAQEQLASGGLTHQERRRLRSVAGAWDAAARRRRREIKHLAIVAAGAIAVMALIGTVLGLGPAIEAANGQGAAGTFMPGHQPCLIRKGGCVWSGTFRLRDGQIVQNVAYAGTLPPGAAGGGGIPAIEPGGSHLVYPPHNSRTWLEDLLLMLLIGGVVGLMLWISPIGLGEHRTTDAIV